MDRGIESTPPSEKLLPPASFTSVPPLRRGTNDPCDLFYRSCCSVSFPDNDPVPLVSFERQGFSLHETFGYPEFRWKSFPLFFPSKSILLVPLRFLERRARRRISDVHERYKSEDAARRNELESFRSGNHRQAECYELLTEGIRIPAGTINKLGYARGNHIFAVSFA